MAVTVVEKIESRPLTVGDTAELIYVIRGTDEATTAASSLDSTAPSSFASLPRRANGLRVEPVHIESGNADACIWTGTVEYALRAVSPPKVGETPKIAFEIGGATQHITQSISTRNSYPAGTAPDLKGAIGYNGESVEGVDIPARSMKFSLTKRLANASVTGTFIGNLYALVSTVNNATFTVTYEGGSFSLAAGECLFVGFSMAPVNYLEWDITYQFEASPNKTGLTVGTITGIEKRGWDYMWVRYSEAVSGSEIVRQPTAVYVEKVFEDGVFSGLGL